MVSRLSILLTVFVMSACATRPTPTAAAGQATARSAPTSASSGESASATRSPARAASQDENRFDAAATKRLGADEYGMKRYVMAFLEAGPNRPTDKREIARLQRAHLDNIKRMADEGVLVLAGPFLDDGDLRGIYIFNVATVEEARRLTETDPAIQAGSLVMTLRPWYGSAALQELNVLHQRISAKSI
jgi:uncharacterized protein YciI